MIIAGTEYCHKSVAIWYGWLSTPPGQGRAGTPGSGAKGLCHLKDRKQSDVWQIDRPKKSPEHPTMKPIALAARAIENSSRVGDIVLDLFGGSGTTLMAAEQSDRTAYLMELDPKYCDCIVKRYIQIRESDEGVYLLRDNEKMMYSEVPEPGGDPS